MTDLFNEVEEQLRSDRYRVIARKAAPWVVAIIAAGLAAFLAVWGWQRYQSQAADKASQQYTDALGALEQGQQDRAVQLLNGVAKSSARAYKSLALMQLAGIKIGSGAAADVPAAVALLDQAAAAAPDDILGDAARLKSAFAVLDTAPFKDVEARLTPLMKDGHPYRVQAREALAFAKMMAGNTAGARDDFTIIEQTLDAPEGARQRATAAKALIESGSAKALPAAAKAAAMLPAPATPMPDAALQAQPQEAPGPQ